MTREEATEFFLKQIDLIRGVIAVRIPLDSQMDDIVHDTYVYFLENAARWDNDEKKLKGLLHTIALNMVNRRWHTYIRHLPQTLKQICHHLKKEATEQSPSSDCGLDERILLLRICLKNLSDENRRLIEVFYFDGMSYEELQSRFGRTSKALYSKMCRLRAQLFECMTKKLKSGDLHDK